MITALARSPLRAAAVAALIALTLGAAACGDSDDDADKQASAGAETTAQTETEQAPAGDEQPAAASGGDEQQIRALMDQMRKAFADLDGQAACPLMTEDAQTQIASATNADCAKGFETIFGADKVDEDLKPSDLRFEIDGDKASVSGYTSHTKDRQTAQFVKEGDDWRVQVWFTN